MELVSYCRLGFPISRDPPEGGTNDDIINAALRMVSSFQFLGIPPKGELCRSKMEAPHKEVSFPISRDPPEGGTRMAFISPSLLPVVSNF